MQNRAKIIHGKNAAVYLTIVGFIDIFCFNKKMWCGILYVDAKKCKNDQNWPFLDQVMTYFVKYDFMIVAKFRMLNL